MNVIKFRVCESINKGEIDDVMNIAWNMVKVFRLSESKKKVFRTDCIERMVPDTVNVSN